MISLSCRVPGVYWQLSSEVPFPLARVLKWQGLFASQKTGTCVSSGRLSWPSISNSINHTVVSFFLILKILVKYEILGNFTWVCFYLKVPVLNTHGRDGNPWNRWMDCEGAPSIGISGWWWSLYLLIAFLLLLFCFALVLLELQWKLCLRLE